MSKKWTPEYSLSEKKKIVERLRYMQGNGFRLREACKEIGVSYNSFKKWLTKNASDVFGPTSDERRNDSQIIST